jgi:hypothetical protein
MPCADTHRGCSDGCRWVCSRRSQRQASWDALERMRVISPSRLWSTEWYTSSEPTLTTQGTGSLNFQRVFGKRKKSSARRRPGRWCFKIHSASSGGKRSAPMIPSPIQAAQGHRGSRNLRLFSAWGEKPILPECPHTTEGNVAPPFHSAPAHYHNAWENK